MYKIVLYFKHLFISLLFLYSFSFSITSFILYNLVGIIHFILSQLLLNFHMYYFYLFPFLSKLPVYHSVFSLSPSSFLGGVVSLLAFIALMVKRKQQRRELWYISLVFNRKTKKLQTK